MEEIKNEEIKSLVGAKPENLANAIAEILDNKKAKETDNEQNIQLDSLLLLVYLS